MPSWFGIKKSTSRHVDPNKAVEEPEGDQGDDQMPLKRGDSVPAEPTNAQSRMGSRSTESFLKDLKANGIEQAPSPVAEVANRPKVPVYVNVYNLMNPESNKKFGYLGVGIYHSGVVVYGQEWSFGGSRDATEGLSGVFGIVPRAALPAPMFHSSVHVGDTAMSREQVQWALQGMGREWTMDSYQILTRNCNHFSEAFCKKLGVTYPSWVNRAAKLSNAIVPRSLLEYVLSAAPQPPAADEPPGGKRAKGCGSKRCKHNHSHGGSPQHAHSHSHGGADSHQAAADAAGPPEPIPPIPDDLSSMSVRQLRTLMFLHHISWADCVEKSDMVSKLQQAAQEQEQQATSGRTS